MTRRSSSLQMCSVSCESYENIYIPFRLASSLALNKQIFSFLYCFRSMSISFLFWSLFLLGKESKQRNTLSLHTPKRLMVCTHSIHELNLWTRNKKQSKGLFYQPKPLMLECNWIKRQRRLPIPCTRKALISHRCEFSIIIFFFSQIRPILLNRDPAKKS